MRNIFILSITLLMACGGDSTECSVDTDCFAGETCQDGLCLPGTPANNTNNTNNTSNNTQTNNSNNTQTNNSNNTQTNNTNNTQTNNTNNANNTQTNNTNNVSNGVCLVDQFASCDDPLEAENRNDDWSDADRPGSSLGCPGGDNVEPASWSVDGQLCGREAGDWYGQIVIPCDTLTLVATAKATPTESCEHDEWSFVFNRGGARIACDDPGIECSTEGNSKILRWTIEPSFSLSSYYVGVEGPGAQFAYTIDFTIE